MPRPAASGGHRLCRVTHRTFTALAALVAVGVGGAFGAAVAMRWRARFDDRPAAEPLAEVTVAEELVLERPPYEAPRGEGEGDVPSGALTYGTAMLRLGLRDDRSGDPVAMKVRLWRLEVPEDAAWSAGDEMRTALDVPEYGVTIGRLPAGRYRVQCLDARDAPDPPEFEISDGVNERDVPVPVRRWFRVRLRLVDEQGEVIPRSMRCEGGGPRSIGSWDDDPPHWASPRQPKSGEPYSIAFRSGAVGHAYPQDTGPIVSADGDGYFFVGRYREPSRGGYERSSMSFEAESRAGVGVGIGWNDEPGVDSTFVGVAPSHVALLAHVILPNGDAVDPTDARVGAWCAAEQHAWAPPADAWRSIPVSVTVTVPRCEPLEFVWTAATAEEERQLIPLPPRPLR